jgi:hypothetical protein
LFGAENFSVPLVHLIKPYHKPLVLVRFCSVNCFEACKPQEMSDVAKAYYVEQVIDAVLAVFMVSSSATQLY